MHSTLARPLQAVCGADGSGPEGWQAVPKPKMGIYPPGDIRQSRPRAASTAPAARGLTGELDAACCDAVAIAQERNTPGRDRDEEVAEVGSARLPGARRNRRATARVQEHGRLKRRPFGKGNGHADRHA